MNDYWDTSMPKSPPPWILNPLAGGRYKGCSHRFHRRMYYSMSTMSDSFAQRHDALIHTDDDPAEIDLRNPLWAAFWALLWPGSGHIYQRRYSKGILLVEKKLFMPVGETMIIDGNISVNSGSEFRRGPPFFRRLT